MGDLLVFFNVMLSTGVGVPVKICGLGFRAFRGFQRWGLLG
jgi:hypothetical protein